MWFIYKLRWLCLWTKEIDFITGDTRKINESIYKSYILINPCKTFVIFFFFASLSSMGYLDSLTNSKYINKLCEF